MQSVQVLLIQLANIMLLFDISNLKVLTRSMQLSDWWQIRTKYDNNYNIKVADNYQSYVKCSRKRFHKIRYCLLICMNIPLKIPALSIRDYDNYLSFLIRMIFLIFGKQISKSCEDEVLRSASCLSFA